MNDDKGSVSSKPAAGSHGELDQALAFLKRYGQPIALGVAAVLLVSAGATYFRTHRRTASLRASRELSDALAAGAPAAHLTEIADRHARTPAGPLTLLAAAAQQFEEQDFSGARAGFESFLTQYPKHPEAPVARIGLAYCDEGEQRLEEALAGFRAAAEAHPDHYLAVPAILGQGRCLEQLARLDEARAIYEDFIIDHPDSRWLPHAETALLYVHKEIRAAE